jgi:2-isopropylmalate synthase
LGKHSGRHALRLALADLGIALDGQALNTAFKRFKEVADRKGQVTAMDLEALVADELRDETTALTLQWFDVWASTRGAPRATVEILTPEGREVMGSSGGDGPVDALSKAINDAVGIEARLREFRVDAVTDGPEALGQASVVIECDGAAASGQGVATDLLEAAAIAYIRALSKAWRRRAAGDTARTPSPAAVQP